MRAWESIMVTVGVKITFTPPAMARFDSRRRRLWHARWTATRDEEHAVSTVKQGPRKSRRYDRRLPIIDRALPAPRYPSRFGGDCVCNMHHSMLLAPMKTPVLV